jgi:hypothetical protein
MCQQRECPVCHEYTVYYDPYFDALCCSRFSCTYFEKLNEDAEEAA